MPAPTIPEHELALLIEFFGKDKLITEITDDDVARWCAWRRGHRRKDCALISPRTVNHTIMQLKAVHPRRTLGRAFRARAASGASICLPVPA